MLEKQFDDVLRPDGHAVARATGIWYGRKKRVTRNVVERIPI
jgi:hypothetical protein